MPVPKKMTGKPAVTPVKGSTAAPPKPAPAAPPKPPVKPPVKSEKELITVTAKDVGTVPAGLIPSKSTAPMKVAIPSFLQQSNMPTVSNRQQTGYVGFASTQSKKWSLMQQAGLDEGQPFLNHQNAFIPLETLDFFLLKGASYKTMMAGKDGTFVYATTDMDVELPDQIYKGNVVKLEPHYICLLLVNVNSQLIPIKGDFRGTKSGGIENAIRAVEAASDPDWLKLSDAHRVTAAFPQPFGRVYHRITTKRGVSKSNGNPYFSAECTSSPASIKAMEALVASLSDEGFNNMLTAANTNFESRITFMEAVVEKGSDMINGNNGNGDSNSAPSAEPIPF